MSVEQIIKLKQQISELTRLKQYPNAKQAAIKLVNLSPKDLEAWFALAQLQEVLGEKEDAIKSLYQVCQAKTPMLVPALRKIVLLAKVTGLHHLGIKPAQELLKIDPKAVDVLYELGMFWFKLHHYVASAACLERLNELHPGSSMYTQSLAQAYCFSGEAEKGLKVLEDYMPEHPLDNSLVALYAMSSNYTNTLTSKQELSAHQKLSELNPKTTEAVSFDHLNKDKIRIGYLSPDFGWHSVSFFFMAMVEGHSRDRFEVVCYSDRAREDDVTNKIKQASDKWVNCSQMTDEDLLKQIREDNVHILVDLVGLSGNHRYSVFQNRAAPVQVTYLGYPNTSGLSEMDFRIVDGWTDPVGAADEGCVEELMRLDQGFLCYSQLEAIPEVCEPPCLKSEHICFGVFNNFLKITPDLIACWAKLLSEVDGSSLFIKTKPLIEDALKEKVWKRFEENGIAKERVRLQGWTPEIGSHLELYNEVDIHLDTYPYNGTTTTLESLRQGVPVVSIMGEAHRSRVGFSILSQVGLEALVAKDQAEYVAIAKQLAGDREQLATLRKSLRERVNSSDLMNRERFINELENAYDKMLAKNINY